MQIPEPDERKWYLAARSLTGMLTAEEESEWAQVMEDENFKSQFERIRKYWNDSEKLPYLQINVEEDWMKVAGKIRSLETVEEGPWLPRVLRYAAVIAVVLMAGVFVWKMTRSAASNTFLSTIEAPKGARTSITLPDSSHVWLNAESRITFDQQFGKEHRDLSLEGEAFFDVKKGSVPFQVHTGSYDIAVLGTAFNVKVYPDDEMTTTTLVHGSLKVTRANAQGETEEVLLHPNERIVLKGNTSVRINNPMVLEKNIDAAAEADWKDGWLTVRGESLGDLSKKIERLYNVKIDFQDENMKSYRYSGRIQQFSLEQVMNALALTSPVRFEIREKLVKLSIDESKKAKYNYR
jgi:ferric-dicitrate binding protein FerR (iron transport regulator)